ncbi:MAG: pyrroline-5-carboxylate reductase [bacterium]
MKKIGFIGAGKMAQAIINGVLKSNFTKTENIYTFEPDLNTVKALKHNLEINFCKNNNEVVQNSDIIIICVKPHFVETVLKEINGSLNKNKIIVSIAAGVSTKKMEQSIDSGIPVVRVMPNTPALVGEGMSALCKGKYCSDETLSYIKELFSKLGRAIEVEEKFINAVTGISGSGPAFMYLIIEALADGGVKLGLRKDVALELAAQTALGAAKMILETGKHPSILKDEVTTPAGTTAEGLYSMEKDNIRASLIRTVIKTARRADELG